MLSKADRGEGGPPLDSALYIFTIFLTEMFKTIYAFYVIISILFVISGDNIIICFKLFKLVGPALR